MPSIEKSNEKLGGRKGTGKLRDESWSKKSGKSFSKKTGVGKNVTLGEEKKAMIGRLSGEMVPDFQQVWG